MSSSWPTQRIVSSSGWARWRMTPSISTFMNDSIVAGSFQTHERIANHHVHPAEPRNTQIEAFGEVASGIVRRQDEVRTRAELQVGFVYLARNPAYAFMDIIGCHRLWRAS